MVQLPLVVFIVESIHNNLQTIVRHDLSLVVGKEGAYQEEKKRRLLAILSPGFMKHRYRNKS
ncbi:hypothetical protein YA38_05010 [Klebsiella aerogenes]|nr:hypothetical protein YA38_05010 [Klebsiella aerogenes]